jgi:hypothetical protein
VNLSFLPHFNIFFLPSLSSPAVGLSLAVRPIAMDVHQNDVNPLTKYSIKHGENRYRLFAGGAAIVLCFGVRLLARTRDDERRRRRDFVRKLMSVQETQTCRRLLNRLLPDPRLAEPLLRGQQVVVLLKDVTYLFSDIKGRLCAHVFM